MPALAHLVLSFVLPATILLELIFRTADAATIDVDVDLELIVAVDVSDSISAEELRLQREGYVQAFRDPGIAAAIASGDIGSIAILYLEWAGPAHLHVLLPWTVLTSAGDAAAFADALAAEPLPTGSFGSNQAMSFGRHLDPPPIATATATSISASLLFALERFRERRFRSNRQVIDVSGNGTNNAGPPLAPVRDLLVSEGVVINGLPITWSAEKNTASPTSFGKTFVERYFEDCVIGGPGAFAIADRQWFLSAYRDRARGRFSQSDGRYLAQVAASFGRIVALAEKLEAERVSAALTVLDQLQCPALLMDSRGRIRNVNDLAESLLEHDLHLRCGHLRSSDPRSNRRIQQLVEGILAVAPGSTPSLNQIVVNRANVPWLLIEAMPVTDLGSDIFHESRALLLLTDLTRPAVSDAKLLATVFGLTPAEAKLAACIASGVGIDAAATALGIGRETVKSHLGAVFLKTYTRCQPELVALMGRLRSANRA